MPQFEATLPDGRIASFEADRQPTDEEFAAYLKSREPKTSALGAGLRAGAEALGPTTAAMAAFPGGAEIGGAIGSPLGPVGVAAGALIGGGITSTIAAIGASSAIDIAKEGLRKVDPEAMQHLEDLEQADIVQHPYARTAGELAAMVPSAEVSPLKNVYGLAKLPKLLAGKLEGQAGAIDAKAAKEAVAAIGGQAGLQVGTSLVREHKLPSPGELLEGAVAATLFGEPRFRLLPKQTAAVAKAITERLPKYAPKERQVEEGVQGERAGDDAQRTSAEAGAGGGLPPAAGVEEKTQIPLSQGGVPVQAKISGNAKEGWTVEYGGQTEKYGSLAEAQIAAHQLNNRSRKVGEKPAEKPIPEGPHVMENTSDEQDEYERQEREGMAMEKEHHDAVRGAATKLGVEANLTKEPLGGGAPFATGPSGIIARPNRRTGQIDINQDELAHWLTTIPKEQHGAAIESLMSEEHIHSKVEDAEALAYWNSLTKLEKAIVNRRYHGSWKMDERFSPTDMGHEAIAGRLQQLLHLTPREVIEATGHDKWTYQSLLALERMVHNIRQAFGTTASTLQRDMLNRLHGQISVARAAMAMGAAPGTDAVPVANGVIMGPGAFNKKLWHVSRHEFEKFDIGKIGTGEGAQSWGWGLYLAENKGTRDYYTYQPEMSRGVSVDGAEITNATEVQKHMAAQLQNVPYDQLLGNYERALEYSKKQLAGWKRTVTGSHQEEYLQRSVANQTEAVNTLREWKGKKVSILPGHVYEVRLNAGDDELIHSFKSMAQQSPKVQEALKWDFMNNPKARGPGGERMPVMQWLNVDAVKAAELRARGIKGIKYPDEESRPGGFTGQGEITIHHEGYEHSPYPDHTSSDPYDIAAHMFEKHEYDQEAARVEQERNVFYLSKENPDRSYQEQALRILQEGKFDVSKEEYEHPTHNYVVFHHDDINVVDRNRSKEKLEGEFLAQKYHELKDAWENRLGNRRGPAAYSKQRKLTPDEQVEDNLRQAKAGVAALERRKRAGMAVNAQEDADVRKRLEDAWAAALDSKFPGPAAYNKAQRDDPKEVGKQIGFDVKRNDFPGMKVEGMPPEMIKEMSKTVKPVWEFTNRSAPSDDPMAGITFYVREGATREEIINSYNEKRKQAGLTPDFPAPAAFNKKAAAAEEERRKRLAAERARKAYYKSGETGQDQFFMPPSAEKVVEPISAEQAGALGGMTEGQIGEMLPPPKMSAIEISGVHGLRDKDGKPLPDKPGLVDTYLNQPIVFTAGPKERTAEVQGQEQEFTEYTRRTKRPSFRGFMKLVKEQVHIKVTDEQMRDIWADAVWRHVMQADDPRLVQLAKTSRKKSMASWQTGTEEQLLRRLEPGAPVEDIEPEPEETGPQLTRGPETGPRIEEGPKKGQLAATTQPATSRFALEGEMVGVRTQKEIENARRAEFFRLRRERIAEALKRGQQVSKNRANIQGVVAMEMIAESIPPSVPVERTAIGLDDIDYANEKVSEAPVHTFTDAENKDPTVMFKVLSDGARSFPDATHHPLSHTERLVALIGTRPGNQGQVELVSVYAPSLGELIVVDPEKHGLSDRPGVPIADLISGERPRYKAIQSLLLTNPVKDFRWHFDNAQDYFKTIGTGAEENYKAQKVYEFTGEEPRKEGEAEEPHVEEIPGRPRGTGVTEGEGGGFQGPAAELGRGPQGLGNSRIAQMARDPIHPSEAMALRSHIMERTGGNPTEENFHDIVTEAVGSGLKGAQRRMVTAIVKATNAENNRYRRQRAEAIAEYRAATPEQRKQGLVAIPPEKTHEQIYEETLKSIYSALTSTDSEAGFLKRVMGQFSPPPQQALSIAQQLRPRTDPRAQGVSRELTMRERRPPTAVTGEAQFPPRLTPAPPGGRPGVVLPPEMLAARPAQAGEQPRGAIEQSEALTRRGIQMDPFSHRRAEDPTTLRRMVPSPGMDIVSAPGGHPLGRPDPLAGRVEAEAPLPSMREPNVLEAEVTRLAGQRMRQAKEEQEKMKYLPGMGPAAFNKSVEEAKVEWERIKTSVAAALTQRETKESIYTNRDRVDNFTNVVANNGGNITRDASKGILTEALQKLGIMSSARRKEIRENEKKAEVVRRATIAVVSSGDIVAGGGTYVDKFGRNRQRTFWAANKERLTAPMAFHEGGVPNPKRSGLIAMAEEAMKQAQIAMGKKDPWYQHMGRKWLQAATELRDAAVWARDHWLDPQLKETVATARNVLREQWQFEADNGSRIRRDWNYVPGRYDAELWNDNKVFFGQQRILGRNFRMPGSFDNYYEAILAGPYIAKNLDIADLVEHRVRQGGQMVNKNVWYGVLKKTIDPATKNPVAMEIERGDPEPLMEKGQILRDARGRWKTDEQGNPIRGPDVPMLNDKGMPMTTPGKLRLRENYEIVTFDNGRKQLAVLRDYKYAVQSAAGESPLRQTPVTREMLAFGQWIKHYGILIYDSFHPARLAQYSLALGGKPTEFGRGRAALEYREQDLDRAVQVGSITQGDADWAREKLKVNFGNRQIEMSRIDLVHQAIKEGANLGRLQDALYGEAKHFMPGVSAMNKFVFRKMTRGLMAEAIVRNFEVLNAKHPNVPVSTLMRDVSKDMNFFFGSIGRQGILKSPMLRDFAQMIMLAPQWVEGLAQKEVRFYSRLSGVSTLAGRQGPYLGALGGAMAKGLLFWFGMAQVINLITRQKTTFQNEEEGHKLDAFIPTGKTGFWISPMSVFAEMSHDILRLFETKPTAWDVADQIGRNKLGPWGRVGIVLTTKQNNQGEFIPTTAGRAWEAAKQLGPVPITLSYGWTALKSKAGVGRAPQPGSFMRQVFASVGGIKGQAADSPLQQITRIGNRFVKDHNLRADTYQLEPTTEASYSKMRSALRAGDVSGAESLLNELRQHHTDSQIYHAMNVWSRSPITGSRRNERQFVASMSPEERQLYSQAMEERLNLLQGFVQMYVHSKHR